VIVVMGGLRTTPMDVLDIHAFILPIHLEIDRQCHRAATRIATLPPAHPLYKPARNCANRKVKRHKSPLHMLIQTYEIRPNDTENIRATPRNPALSHKRLFSVNIAASKDASMKEDAQATEKIKVYSDGSAQNGNVGAAAILTRTEEPTRKLHFHLGPSSQHTVHEAELVGLLLGLHLIKTDKKGKTGYALGADNQAALSALNAVDQLLVNTKLTRYSKQQQKSRNNGIQQSTLSRPDGQRDMQESKVTRR